MRIAVNTRFLLPGRLEGFGWYTHEIMRRMVERHPENEYLFLFDRPFDPAFVYSDRVKPLVLYPPARHPLLFYAWFEYAVPRALRQWKADVFFSPDSFLSLSTPVPTVLTVHDMIPLQMPDQIKWIHRMYYNMYLKRFIQRADKVVTVSSYTQQSITEITGKDPRDIIVAYNGCRDIFRPVSPETQTAVRAQYAGGQPYFFYSGAIHPRKNIPRLIRAFDGFKKATGSPVKLLLGGRFAWQTGEVTAAYESVISKQDIHFLGYVPDEVLPQLLGSAVALTYPSLSEGFGLPVLEAMYCDTPVIAGDNTAIPEVAGDAAILVDAYNENAITEAMLRMWNDPQYREDLIRKGRVQRTGFSWDLASEAVYGGIKLVSSK